MNFLALMYILLTLFNMTQIPAQVPPNDPQFPQQWNLSMPGTPSQRADIRTVEAWTITTGDPLMKIAIVEQDGFPNSSHPDLNGRDIISAGFVSEHTTQFAGIIGAAANNAEGIAGVNW